MGRSIEQDSCSLHLATAFLSGGISAATGASAAAALGHPAGAAGGALGGLAGALIGKTVTLISENVLGDSPRGKVIANVFSAIATFFAQAGATVGVSSLLGKSITFGSACTLTAAAWGIGVAAFFVLGSCFVCCGACDPS